MQGVFRPAQRKHCQVREAWQNKWRKEAVGIYRLFAGGIDVEFIGNSVKGTARRVLGQRMSGRINETPVLRRFFHRVFEMALQMLYNK